LGITQNKPEYFYTRGLIYYYQKEWKMAIPDFTKAIEIDPKFGLAYYARACAYYHLKDRNNSLNDYETYLRLSGNQHNLANETQRMINVLLKPEE
jgi:tetratricopeptide (TPR) repeat protein